MSKLNKTGFMLAEVVVVSVVIAVTLVSLFVGLNKVTKAYDKRNKYYDIDAEYLALELTKKRFFYEYVEWNTCSKIEKYEITGNTATACYIYYDTDSIKTVKNNNNLTETFKEYLDYIANDLDPSNPHGYIVAVEIQKNKDKDKCVYYSVSGKIEPS